MNKTIANEKGELQVLSQAAARRYRGMTDDQLLAQVASGDDSAGVFLVFHRHGDVLQKLTAQYAERGCFDALSGELVSEVYIHFASRGWACLLPQHLVNVRGYLYCVERNLLRQLARRDFRHQPPAQVPVENPAHSSDGIGGYEAADMMESALARLSATRRFVLGKRLVEGYGSKEVASMLPEFWRSIGERHLSAPTHAYVDNVVSAARKDLRQMAGV